MKLFYQYPCYLSLNKSLNINKIKISVYFPSGSVFDERILCKKNFACVLLSGESSCFYFNTKQGKSFNHFKIIQKVLEIKGIL